MSVCTKDDIALAKKRGDVTHNGVAFDWWLASINGAGFMLYREPHHTDQDIDDAKSYLRSSRDVVSLKVAKEVA
jgi:dihydroxyacetone kinase